MKREKEVTLESLNTDFTQNQLFQDESTANIILIGYSFPFSASADWKKK